MPIKNIMPGIFVLLSLAGAAFAADDVLSPVQAAVQKLGGGCPVAETVDAEGQPVLLWQHLFEDGSHDLAMARTQQGRLGDIHRVTFGGSRQAGCHYHGLALARGGDWGWHLAWALDKVEPGKAALRYARMDGAAWVSSPAKRFGGDSAHAPRLQVDGENITLQWRETVDGREVERSASSAAGGRSWN